MSNQSAKRNVRLTAILAIVIVAIIAGGLGYQMTRTQPNTSMTSETSMMESSSASQAAVSILGAGATFPAPLLQTWTVQYNKIYPAVTINYNPIGSGGGIQQITQKTVDFGASDAPLSDKQLANATGLTLFPETLGGVAVTYNLQSLGVSNSTSVKFTGDIIARIYMGQITKWNDPAIQALNPGVPLPSTQITAVHRSDGSGTTYAFTNYLSVVNQNWATNVGYSTSVTWPVDKAANGVGAKGNAGVAGTVTNTPGAVGYVDVIYAVSNHLGVGAVQNGAGNFVLPTLQTILYAAANATGTPNPQDLRLHIVNASGAQSYPIATYTYILVYKDMSLNPSMNLDKAKALAKFLWWAIHDGQQYSSALIYVPLPNNVVSADEQLLLGLNYQGQPLLSQ
ncbi:MAG: phosphate ABC transporter substrate-binding protein PstS [Candidatus Bathyarchaeia archaeon]